MAQQGSHKDYYAKLRKNPEDFLSVNLHVEPNLVGTKCVC